MYIAPSRAADSQVIILLLGEAEYLSVSPNSPHLLYSQGQAGAIRLGIARALEAYDPNLRQLLAPGNKMILIYLRCCFSIQLTF